MTLSDFTPEERFLLKKALSRLSAYDDTPRALCERLMKLSYRKEPVGAESCKKVVRFLHAQGLINERVYFENLFSALKSRGYGSVRILNEFHRRKFSARIIEAARERLSDEAESSSEFSRAYSALKKRAENRKSDFSDEAECRRLYGYLARLGFRPGDVREAINQLKQEKETK